MIDDARMELDVGSWELGILKSCGSSGEYDDNGNIEKKEEKERSLLDNTIELTIC